LAKLGLYFATEAIESLSNAFQWRFFLLYFQSDFAQTIDNPFDNIFEFYKVIDQNAAPGWKIGFELEKIFNSPFPLFVPSQLTERGSLGKGLP